MENFFYSSFPVCLFKHSQHRVIKFKNYLVILLIMIEHPRPHSENTKQPLFYIVIIKTIKLKFVVSFSWWRTGIQIKSAWWMPWPPKILFAHSECPYINMLKCTLIIISWICRLWRLESGQLENPLCYCAGYLQQICVIRGFANMLQYQKRSKKLYWLIFTQTTIRNSYSALIF